MKKTISLFLVLTILLSMALITPGFADEAADKQLCEDFYVWYCGQAPNFAEEYTAEDVSIQMDFGSYAGGRVVLMDIYQQPFSSRLYQLIIGGHLFQLELGLTHRLFVVYKDGTFSTVFEAFYGGQLTKADLDAVYESYLSQGGYVDEALAASEELLFCEEYMDWLGETTPDFMFMDSPVYSVEIAKEYGTYAGGRVVLMKRSTLQEAGEHTELVGGHLFSFGPRYYCCERTFVVYQDGRFSRVGDAFRKGQLTQEEIDAVYASYLAQGGEAVEVTEQMLEDKRICEEFYPWFGEHGGVRMDRYLFRYSPDDVYIQEDYGSYDGGRLLLMGILAFPMAEEYLPLMIGGHIFLLGSSSYRNMFVVYKDGKFTLASQAFLAGQLTQADIDAAYQAYLDQGGQVVEWNYPDVPESAWYYSYVTCCAYRGLMMGFEDNSFRPNVAMTRAMFVTVLYRFDLYENSQHHSVKEHSFTDVKPGIWYEDAVAWAAGNGIVKGTGETTFSPNDALTREQAVTMLKRYAQHLNVDTTGTRSLASFPDEKNCADWAVVAVRWMKQAGIIQGDDKGYFRPKKTLTRAECAKVLLGLSDYVHLPHDEDEGPVKELTAGIDRNPAGSYRPRADRSDRQALLNFCVNLSKQTLTAGKNDVVSPVSALYALGMVSNGAKENTLKELEDCFGLDTAELNNYLRRYTKLLTKSDLGTVNLADSIWINEAKGYFTANPDYLQALVDYYDAPAYYGVFNQELCDALNDWISENTYGLIPKMLDNIAPDATLYLVNTLALKLKWEGEVEGSYPWKFYPENGDVQTCQFFGSEASHYLQDQNTIGFLKPYENGMKFVALLPNEGISMQDYLESLTGEKLALLLDNPESQCHVFVKIPEFKTESSFSLQKPMEALGVDDVFMGGVSDLSGMGNTGLYVTKILQNVNLKLDKNGIEAAAATVIPGTDGLPDDDMPIYWINLNRPFVYMIMDSESNLPLFIGVVNSMN